MSLSVTCDCGKSLKLKDSLAGKRIRCPGCQEILTVPAAQVEEPKDDEEPVPKKAPARSSAIGTSKAKAKRPAEMDDEDDEDEEEARPVRQKNRKKAGKQQAPNYLPLILQIGVGVVAVGVIIGAVIFIIRSREDKTPDMAANNPSKFTLVEPPRTPNPTRTDSPGRPQPDPSKDPMPASVGSLTATFNGHKAGVALLAFSGDGKTLASYGSRSDGTKEPTVYCWDIASKSKRKALSGYIEKYDVYLRSLAITNDGGAIYAATYSPMAVVRIDVASDTVTRELLTPAKSTIYADISPDGSLVAAAEGKKVFLWRNADAVKPDPIGESEENVDKVSLSANGMILLAAGSDKVVKVWDLRSSKATTIQGGADKFSDKSLSRLTALSRDGTTVAVPTSEAKGMRLVDAMTGTEKVSIPAMKTIITSIALSPDGSLLAIAETGSIGAQAHPITLWDARSGKQLGMLEGHEGWIHTMTFSPDGQFLASGGRDNGVKLWTITVQK